MTLRVTVGMEVIDCDAAANEEDEGIKKVCDVSITSTVIYRKVKE